MKTYTPEQLQEAFGRALNNRIYPEELAVRFDELDGNYSRLLWLPGYDDNREFPPLCLELLLTRREELASAWRETGSTPVMLRLSEAVAPEAVRQYRVLVPYSPLYRRLAGMLARELGASAPQRLLQQNYLQVIDWRLFLKNAHDEAGQLVCNWSQCRLAQAALGAQINRQLDGRRRSFNRYPGYRMG